MKIVVPQKSPKNPTFKTDQIIGLSIAGAILLVLAIVIPIIIVKFLIKRAKAKKMATKQTVLQVVSQEGVQIQDIASGVLNDDVPRSEEDIEVVIEGEQI